MLRSLGHLRLACIRLKRVILQGSESLKDVVSHLVLETATLRNELTEQVVVRYVGLA